MNNIPQGLQDVISTTNAGDSDGFVSLFAENGLIDDWGNQYVGTDRIASWNQTDNIGKKSQFTLVDATQEAERQWLLHIKVAGNGFNGTSPFRFELGNDGKISSMTIVPD
ncbi:nuclear transport factor 2 family protein [Lentilactobacillus kosonis]|uniref:Ketosteroid isomerase n=1 Tax=Lentilactobacillus kosonis TaxID=2810561 RepID=A0A401FJ62_9LACO|nr:nuclear transport factor 2 family protein [Lentilactobacillus kosonis]GAY72414.1 hypothetical protein NBRC111893_560 [Lentilactobacillus kosonis]